MGIPDANSAENVPSLENCVITPLYCTKPRKAGDPPILNDLHAITLLPDSLLYSIYGIKTIEAEHYCNYGVNPDFIPRFEAAGLKIAAVAADTGEVRAVEIRQPHHPFFDCTLFHPQLESRPGLPSPLVMAYLAAAKAFASPSSERPKLARATIEQTKPSTTAAPDPDGH